MDINKKMKLTWPVILLQIEKQVIRVDEYLLCAVFRDGLRVLAGSSLHIREDVCNISEHCTALLTGIYFFHQ